MKETTALLNKFSTNLKGSLKKAQNLTMELKHQEVNGEHLLYALSTQKGSLSADILTANKIKKEKIRNFINEKNISKIVLQDIKLSANVKMAIIKATNNAYSYQHKYVGTEHLLLGLLESNDKNINILFKKNSINVKNIKNQIINILKNTSHFPDLNEVFNVINNKDKIKNKPNKTIIKQKDSALDFFGIELTDEKIQKTIDPVIGRETEIQRIIQILCRRTKNNPILLGEAGVGKTAIVEGLAKKILSEKVPEVLLNKKIYTLDLSLLISGAMFRGDFEARFKQVLEEAKEDPNIIIFIDEIHTIIGTGSASGTLDVANILKPALARGDVRCIGATTFSEYKKSIEGDPALERRFQPVKINEPSEDKVVEILSGIKKNYEIFHQVEITKEAIKAATKLSQIYMPNKFFPDKAIDLIDEAAAKLKTHQKPKPETIEINKLIKQLDEIQDIKREAVVNEQFESALESKDIEKKLQEKLIELQKKTNNSALSIVGTIREKDIAQVVSQITSIPVIELTGGEKNKLLNLEKTISKKVIGQDNAVKLISQAIRRSRTNVRNQNQPIGTFMFLGPSGVGKTELAKVVGNTLFGHSSLIRIDMSEFSESFNISKLIGAPAGYVGYNEGGKLSESVKRQPYCVVLLDEFEKAHSDVFNLLLQILDEGYLTDASGKKIDFRNTIIIMTSNIGIDSFNKQAEIGFESESKNIKAQEFDELKNNIKEELNDYFRPEFLNRLDQTIIFNPLTLNGLEKIVKIKIEELNQRLAEKNITLSLDKDSTKWLAQKDFDANNGARTINRNVAQIEDMLAEGILQNKFVNEDNVKIKIKKDKLVLSK